MPASTSSKISVLPGASMEARVFSASMIRDSSPPGGNPRQRPQLLTRIRRDEEFGVVETTIGPGGLATIGCKSNVAARAGHRQLSTETPRAVRLKRSAARRRSSDSVSAQAQIANRGQRTTASVERAARSVACSMSSSSPAERWRPFRGPRLSDRPCFRFRRSSSARRSSTS